MTIQLAYGLAKAKKEEEMDIVILLVLMVAAVISSLVLIYQLIEVDAYATKVESGGFKFVVKGDSLDRVLDNIEGHYVDPTSKKVVRITESNKKPKPKHLWEVPLRWLEDYFGIFWVSIFWPLKRLHKFEIAADKIKPDSGSSAIKDRILIETRPKQNYLRWRFQHPLTVLDVELGKDRWKVNFIVMMDIEITNPSIVIFNYKGTREVLRLSDAAVANEIITFFGREDWDYLKAVHENKGRGSDLEKKILELNGKEEDESSEPEPTPPSETTGVEPSEIGRERVAPRHGLMHRYGIKIWSVRIEAMDLSDSHKGLDEAATEKKKQTLLAAAEEQKGIGRQKYLEAVALGEKAGEKFRREGIAEGFQMMIEKLKLGNDLPPDVIHVLQTHVETANLAGPDSKITHLFKGYSGIVPTINVNQEEKN